MDKLEQIQCEVEVAIKVATWTSIPGPRESETYQGTAPGAVLTVAAFSIEDQGFPPGSQGYDGAVMIERGLLVRLTRKQAERAVELARKAV